MFVRAIHMRSDRTVFTSEGALHHGDIDGVVRFEFARLSADSARLCGVEVLHSTSIEQPRETCRVSATLPCLRRDWSWAQLE